MHRAALALGSGFLGISSFILGLAMVGSLPTYSIYSLALGTVWFYLTYESLRDFTLNEERV